jgi:membrane associated rhomboid family serine protease
MNQFFKGFLASLAPGARALLAVMTLVCLATFIGLWTHAFDLSGWLALTAQAFWHGQLWRLVTYAALPAGLLNFFMNAIMLVMLGGRLERIWSQRGLWMVCIVSTIGAGLAEVLLPFSNSIPLAGAGPMIFGLLAAWCFFCGHERIYLPLFGAMTVWRLVLIVGAVSFLVAMFTVGWRMTAVMAAGGLSGWVYVWLRQKWLMSRDSRVVPSERISRLEL